MSPATARRDTDQATLDGLRAADRGTPDGLPGDSENVAMPCPLRREAIEVRISDEADALLPEIAVELVKGPQEVVRAKSDAYGHVRFDGLVPGSYSLRLPHTDERAWELVSTASLDARKLSSGDATWSAPPTDPEPESYEVALGDCVESVAFQHGFLPETLWSYNENSTLRNGRKDMHILNPGDILRIPQRQDKQISVLTGNLYRLKRKGVPASLNVQILDFTDQPIAGASFLLSVELRDGSTLP
ncbi:MAG TPA: carboxypeptidase-like regulatory domain-containing protein, partial [Bryobacteraceae bacterium]|nr:carboxypeptidase-like regulatory domain-containing protein [Bryobacteraceae bacterium]